MVKKETKKQTFEERVQKFIKEVNEVQEKHNLRLVAKERTGQYIGVEEMPKPTE